jgi:membrane-bound lytic murein transglycosylase B
MITPRPILPSGGSSSNPPVTVGGRPADTLAAWAQRLSRLGIPKVALQAYGYAELVAGRTQPACKLSWTMLAGIGSVESNHGRHGGAKLLESGLSDPKVLGIPLDGTTTERIADTDGGAIDGNATYDQAVGPMQFIPATWAAYGMGGDIRDPHDAVLGAANYLHANGAPGNYAGAVHHYNPSSLYVNSVLRYARAIRRDPSTFYVYWSWQSFMRTPSGDVQLTGPGA